MCLSVKSIFRAMNIFPPHTVGFIYFPAQQGFRSQIPFRSIVTVNVHIIRCVALHKATVLHLFPFYEHRDISPKIDRIVRSKLYITAGILVKHTRQSADSIPYRTEFYLQLAWNKTDEASSRIRATSLSLFVFYETLTCTPIIIFFLNIVLIFIFASIFQSIFRSNLKL